VLGSVLSVTVLPSENFARQLPVTAPAESVQSIPAGVETTRPLPAPLPLTVIETVPLTGSVTLAGDFLEQPTQAETAHAARSADRNCRAITSRNRRADAKIVIVGGEKAPNGNCTT
jgi:hypothetical protein